MSSPCDNQTTSSAAETAYLWTMGDLASVSNGRHRSGQQFEHPIFPPK
jgi:hypothetical protein